MTGAKNPKQQFFVDSLRGDVVEDLAFPKIGNNCHKEKNNERPGDKSPNATDTDESDSDNENCNDNQDDNDKEDDSEDNFTNRNKQERTVFTLKELIDHSPGYRLKKIHSDCGLRHHTKVLRILHKTHTHTHTSSQ